MKFTTQTFTEWNERIKRCINSKWNCHWSFLTHYSGTSSHFYTTPASHQPNPLGFPQQYIVALLNDSRFASARSLGRLSAARHSISKRYSLRASNTSWVSTSGTLPHLYTATILPQLDFCEYLSGTPPHSWAATVHKSYPLDFLQKQSGHQTHLLYGIYEVRGQ